MFLSRDLMNHLHDTTLPLIGNVSSYDFFHATTDLNNGIMKHWCSDLGETNDKHPTSSYEFYGFIFFTTSIS